MTTTITARVIELDPRRPLTDATKRRILNATPGTTIKIDGWPLHIRADGLVAAGHRYIARVHRSTITSE
jgi:hypothetical protein